MRQWDFPEAKSREEKRIKRERYLSTFEEICKSIFYIWGGSVVIFPQVRGLSIFENDRIISKILFERLGKKYHQGIFYSLISKISHHHFI